VIARARWRRLACRWLVGITVAASVASASGITLALPNQTRSLKFAVVGDFGTGEPPSYEVAAQMAAARSRFPFDMVLMVGDNIVGRQSDPSDFVAKFERPFEPLLKSGVRFHGALGNHDKATNRFYPPWNMGGQRYTFARQNVRFFVLDSNRLDRPQLAWFEQALRASKEDWKICDFHPTSVASQPRRLAILHEGSRGSSACGLPAHPIDSRHGLSAPLFPSTVVPVDGSRAALVSHCTLPTRVSYRFDAIRHRHSRRIVRHREPGDKPRGGVARCDRDVLGSAGGRMAPVNSHS
jgi:hypothetical protein